MNRTAFILLAGLVLQLSASASPARADDEFRARVVPILKLHCTRCHGGDEPKGDLDLDTLGPDFAENADLWSAVLDRLGDGSMPPKSRPRPSVSDRTIVTDWIAAGLAEDQKRRAAREGRTRLRRLNRVEYLNTLRDLLGASVDIEQLPEDGVAAGFDNVDAALDLSAPLLESYLETADQALDAVFVKGPQPELTRRHFDMVPLAREITRTIRPMPRYGTSTLIREQENEIVFFSEAMAGKPLLESKAATAGLYRFRVSAHAVNHGRLMTVLVFTGNYGMGTQGLMTRPVAMFDIADTPTVVEFTAPLAARESIRFLPQGVPNVYVPVTEGYSGPGLAMQWVEVEGPIVETWPPAATQRLLGTVDLARATAADGEDILHRFACRAFRRPVADAELAPFVGLFRSRLERGYTFEAALRVGLKGVLCSPDFLFLSATPGRLGDHDLAARLAYFLWSTTPDDTLLALADRGALGKPAVLRAQVERMLGDARAHAFTENFTGQWLSLRNLKMTIPDKKLYPDFDDFLEYSMPLETHAFFEEILRDDRSVVEFLHSDWSMLNERLATLYGISGVTGSAIRKVALPPGSHRGGVMTQAAVLKVTANGTNTSPMIRGAWVLSHILGTPAPPPPKDVPAIEPDIRGARTIRQQLAKHRQIESCASCHVNIDPPGNALENFDVIGGWRDFYRTTAEGKARRVKVATYQGRLNPVGVGPAVDPVDELTGGRKFANVDEFKKLLLENQDQFARSLAEKLLVYATGHKLEYADRTVVDRLAAESHEAHFGLRSLIHLVVQSELFRSK
jgi:hypothetical protein